MSTDLLKEEERVYDFQEEISDLFRKSTETPISNPPTLPPVQSYVNCMRFVEQLSGEEISREMFDWVIGNSWNKIKGLKKNDRFEILIQAGQVIKGIQELRTQELERISRSNLTELIDSSLSMKRPETLMYGVIRKNMEIVSQMVSETEITLQNSVKRGAELNLLLRGNRRITDGFTGSMADTLKHSECILYLAELADCVENVKKFQKQLSDFRVIFEKIRNWEISEVQRDSIRGKSLPKRESCEQIPRTHPNSIIERNPLEFLQNLTRNSNSSISTQTDRSGFKRDCSSQVYLLKSQGIMTNQEVGIYAKKSSRWIGLTGDDKFSEFRWTIDLGFN